MPDNITNNTTGLPENSGIGTNYDSTYTVEKMTNEISKYNLKIGRETDARIAKFYDIVYQMVADMSTDEKKNILIEYGAIDGVSANSSKHVLNAKVTETLITHLENDALENMLRQIRGANAAVTKIVNTSLTKRQAHAKNILNRIDIKDVVNESTELKQMNANLLNRYGSDASGMAKFTSKYPGLKKELKDVLKTCYNNIEIAAIAESMNLQVYKDDDRNDLMNRIIDRVILYVHIITSNNKKNPFAFSVSDPEPYDKLLKLTSYSYITGNPGLTANEWAGLRNRARRARVLMKERVKQSNRRLKSTSTEFREVAGHYNGDVEKELNAGNDNGILANASYDKLIEFAGKYGIDPTKKSIGKLKLEIYRAMAADLRDTRQIQLKANKARKKRINRTLEDKMSLRGDILKANVTSNNPTTALSGIPTVTLDKAGKIPPTESILKAIPVIVVGQKSAEDINAAHNDIESAKGIKVGKRKKRKGINGDGFKTENIQNELSGSDALLFNQFITLKSEITSGSTSDLTTFTNVEVYLSQFVKPSVITTLRSTLTTSGNPSMPLGVNLGIAYLWLYAKINGRTKLASYIDRYFSALIPGKIRRSYLLDRSVKKKVNKQKRKIFRAFKKDKDAPEDLKVSGLNTVPIGGSALSAPPTPVILRSDASSGTNLDYVVPVWIAGKTEDTKDGGIGKNADKATTYGDKYGRSGVRGDNGVLFSKEIADIIKDATAMGYELKSAIFKKPPKGSTIGKTYKIKTEDIEWALSHDYKFARGGKGKGNAFIAGDSTDGKENPEIVKIHDDGAFTVKPIKRKKLDDSEEKLERAKSMKLKKQMSKSSLKVFSTKDIKLKPGIQSTYLVNDFSSLGNILNGVSEEITNMSSWIQERLPSYFMAFGNEVVTAPMGVGTITRPLIYTTYIQDAINMVKNKIVKAIGSGIESLGSTTMATGGTLKTSSGTSAITGDAPGNNIFANGAKPELVQSSGDMTITPLKQADDTKTRQKVQRLSNAERNSALAVGISSHIVKASYTLASNMTDVSNIGEAIKVYSIKPGITDKVDVNGSSYSLMELMVMINAQLASLTQNSAVGNTLLEGILNVDTQAAAKTTTQSTSSSNPFLEGFPSSLDNILQGG